MIVAAATSQPASPVALPIQLAIQSLQEEATETVADTKMEAMNGDPVAEQKLILLGDQQSLASAIAAWTTPPDPGTFLNVKA